MIEKIYQINGIFGRTERIHRALSNNFVGDEWLRNGLARIASQKRTTPHYILYYTAVDFVKILPKNVRTQYILLFRRIIISEQTCKHHRLRRPEIEYTPSNTSIWVTVYDTVFVYIDINIPTKQHLVSREFEATFIFLSN